MTLHTGTVSQPRWSSAPHRVSPARRQFIYGKVQPMDDYQTHWVAKVVILVGVVVGLRIWL